MWLIHGRLTDSRRAVTWIVLITTFAVVVLLRMFVGYRFGWPHDPAIFDIRLNRLFIGGIVGTALAVSGVGLQALLRNPLAEPFILGLSTGAGVGIMGQLLIVTWITPQDGGLSEWGLSTWARFLLSTHYGAMVGAAASLTIIFIASRRHGVIDPLGLLLVGVVLSTINGGVIMFLNFVPGSAGLRENIAQWMMGHINEGLGAWTVWLVAGMTLCGMAILLRYGRAMDVATFSDEEAQSLGVHLGRLRTILFVVASVLAAGAVALARPIAFVGLICPHFARILLGPQHRPLLVGAAVVGAMLMMLADMTSCGLNAVFHWGMMPLGIFTAILGGVAFLWVLRPQFGREV